MTIKAIKYAPQKTGGNNPFPVEDVILKETECHSGNILIKDCQVQHDFTVAQAHEAIKCAQSVEYFIETYCRIISVDEGIVAFKLFQYQRDLLRLFTGNKFVIANMARQMGKTTVVAAYLLWFALFNESKIIGVLANKASQSQEVLDRIRLMFECLPFFLQQGVITYNKQTLEFENKSKIFSAATSSSSIRGKSLSCLYLDELGFVANDMEFYESTYPVITSGKDSRVIITSTPKGKRGLFYKIFSESETGKNKFKNITVKWNRHPNRTEAWRQETLANTSVSQFAQEFDCEFRGSVGTLIPADVLERLSFDNPLIEKEFLRVYQEYNPTRQYMAIVDCAGGVGQDYSIINVIDVTAIPYRQVAVYRNNTISPILFPYTVESVAREYGECPVLVEGNNDMGGQVSYILYYEIEYPNVIMTKPDTKTGQGSIVSGTYNTTPCVKTTKKVKNTGCSNLKTMLENGTLEIVDENTIEELCNFIAREGSYSADSGANDDCVMTLVLFAWLARQEYFKEYSSSDVYKFIFERNRELLEEELLPFGYYDAGQPLDDNPYYNTNSLDAFFRS